VKAYDVTGEFARLGLSQGTLILVCGRLLLAWLRKVLLASKVNPSVLG